MTRIATAAFLTLLLSLTATAQENPITDGIALWLRADAGVTLDAFNRVEAWQDQSGDAYVFAHVDGVPEDRRPLLGQGVLNGQDVVRFDGVDDYLTGGDILDDVFADDDQQFVLFAVTHLRAGDQGAILSKNADSSFNPNEDQRQVAYTVFEGKANMSGYYALGPCCNIQIWSAVSDDNVVDLPLVHTYTYDGSQSDNGGLDRFGIRLNGEADPISFRNSNGPLGSIQDGAAPLAVGARVNTAGTVGNNNFQGDIAELILYDRLLSDEELQHVEVYLGTKYGLDVVGVAVEDVADLPESYSLSAIYPNPFNPQASFRVELPQAQRVRIAAYDVLGREVALLHDGVLGAGERTFTWRGDGLPSGIYVVRVVGEHFAASRQAVLLE